MTESQLILLMNLRQISKLIKEAEDLLANNDPIGSDMCRFMADYRLSLLETQNS